MPNSLLTVIYVGIAIPGHDSLSCRYSNRLHLLRSTRRLAASTVNGGSATIEEWARQVMPGA